MKSKLIVFFLFLQCSFMSAQTITINTVEVCAAQEVLLPVTAASLFNVGAITLYIGFDTNNLIFLSIENVDPQLAGMSTNMMSAPSQLAFAWSNPTAVNFGSGKLFDIKFATNNQPAVVYYNSGCELADPSGFAIPATYINGAINPGLPEITSQPKDTTIAEGGHAMFSVQSPNATSFLWRESLDQGTSWLTLDDGGIYSGTHTEMLSIFPVPSSYDNALYQCLLFRSNCQTISLTAKLNVDELTSADPLPIAPNTKNYLQVTPVPVHNHATVNYIMPEDGLVQLQVINPLGQIVTKIELSAQLKGHHHILLNTSDWHAGVYFLQAHFTLANKKLHQTVKIIKNF
jgi:hypothetical protein